MKSAKEIDPTIYRLPLVNRAIVRLQELGFHFNYLQGEKQHAQDQLGGPSKKQKLSQSSNKEIITSFTEELLAKDTFIPIDIAIKRFVFYIRLDVILISR
jgi:hypothetical protein